MNQHLKGFIETIRSGIWTKGQGQFHTGEDRYCILGAMTKYYEEQTGEKVYTKDGGYAFDAEALLEKVRKFFNFKSRKPQVSFQGGVYYLYLINDGTDLTLQQMSDLICAQEKELVKPDPKPKRDVTKAKNFGAFLPVWMTTGTAKKREKIRA